MKIPAPIVQAGDPVLRRRAGEVPPEVITTAEFQDLVATMVVTMRAAPGVGLAAPQLGIPWRLIVLEDREELLAALGDEERRDRERAPFPVRVLVNPILRLVGDEKRTFFEGCLSVHGYAGLVERCRTVEVAALDKHGAPISFEISGWPARILQHEVDHLDGTLYVDRMLTRSFSTVEQARTFFAGKSVIEVRRLLGA